MVGAAILIYMLPSASLISVGFRCYVEDPTGTELNVRSSPGGKIVGTVPNRQIVEIADRSSREGKEWVFINDWEENSRPIGWVYSRYIVCRKTID